MLFQQRVLRYARPVRAGGVVLIVCIFAALAAATSRGAARQAPCSISAHRLRSGKGLSLSVLCTTDGVEMLRMDFPLTARLVGQTSLKGAVCRDSTSRSWFCIFAYGGPAAVNTPLTGTVQFKAAAPRAAQHGHVAYYLGASGAGAINVSAVETATFSY
jgi:hypothetical protein